MTQIGLFVKAIQQESLHNIGLTKLGHLTMISSVLAFRVHYGLFFPLRAAESLARRTPSNKKDSYYDVDGNQYSREESRNDEHRIREVGDCIKYAGEKPRQGIYQYPEEDCSRYYT
jgi:hypothetical protein